jgi:predicted DNA-binding transcriptional regulator AlpA
MTQYINISADGGDAVEAIGNLSAIESVWLALRKGSKPKKWHYSKGGVRPFSYSEMAKVTGMSRQAVYRMEKRLLLRDDIREYLRDAVPRATHFVRWDAQEG